MINVLVVSFLISLFASFLVWKYGFIFGFVDIPNKRSSHKKITPRGGGIGVTLSLCFITLIYVKDLYGVILISVILSLFSLIDDRVNLPVFLRFIMELLSSIIVVFFYKEKIINSIVLNYGIFVGIFVFIFIVIVITAATNFFNFMDGIDGIAGFESVISFILLAYYTYFININYSVFLLSVAIVAASIGFLFFNFPKSKIFMGDVGSIFIGFTFVSFSFIIAKDISEFLLLLMFQSVFYIDCISTIILRKYRKERITQAHLQHFYQRLVHNKNFTHVSVTLIYGIIQMFIGIILLLLMPESLVSIIVVWIFLFVFYALLRVKYLKDTISEQE